MCSGPQPRWCRIAVVYAPPGPCGWCPDNRAAPARGEWTRWELHPRCPPTSSPALPHRPGVHVLISCYGPIDALLAGRFLKRWAGAAAPTQRSMSGIPNVRLDHRVARDLRCRDSVATVVDMEDVARSNQSYRRRLTSLLEPCSVELDLRPVEVTGTEADVCERNPCRCERRMCDTPPFSRSSRVRTGGVEPPQPWATRLQRAELADARRPQES